MHTPDDALIALEHQTADAIQRKDAAAMAALLADEFVARAPGAPDTSRADFLRALASGPDILRISSDELKVSQHGEVATISGVQRARVRLPDGSEVDANGAFVDVCAWRGGRWVIVLAITVELPAK